MDGTLPATEYVSLNFSCLTDKGCLKESDRDSIFDKILSKPDNRTCCDCHSRNPEWISSSFGICVCLSCAGHHRSLGTGITLVRSVNLDLIKPEEALKLEIGGNSRAIQFFRQYGCEDNIDYRSKHAMMYKNMLEEETQHLFAELLPEYPYQKAAVDAFVKPKAPSFEIFTKPEQQEPQHTSPFAANFAMPSTVTGRRAQEGKIETVVDFDFDAAFEEAETQAEKQAEKQVVVEQKKPASDFLDYADEAATASSSRATATTAANVLPVSVAESAPTMPAEPVADAPPAEVLGSQRFVGAKGISSDAYFRADDSKQTPNETRKNLNRFSGAQAISSDDYFNKAETSDAGSHNDWNLMSEETAARLAILQRDAHDRIDDAMASASTMYQKATSWWNGLLK